VIKTHELERSAPQNPKRIGERFGDLEMVVAPRHNQFHFLSSLFNGLREFR
jgi:hypothetical protein